MARRLNDRVVRAAFIGAVGSLLAHISIAAEPDRVQRPLSPQESLDQLVVAANSKVELVAHEPQVVDPVAIRFDEDGRLWVVEMRDYPTAAAEGNRGGSRISILTDADGDGFFEKSTVFADNLRYATGLQPWKGGVFVTTAGRIAYMKDLDGDDRADLVETWYQGFAEENSQLRANHPRLALDNHIYVANGLRGGQIVDAQSPGSQPVSISGMDFRFDPRTRKFEAVSGVGQFGLTFDDFGNRFVCSNRNPAVHVVLEDWYLKKNPLFAPRAVSTDVAKAGAESRIFPIAPAWTTSHLHANQFTAACGLEIYRGNSLPTEYHGNLFVCEPTAHVVHREIVQPDGVTFRSAPTGSRSEFLASRDAWWSPVNLELGPDGALYVVDMYRAVIEHPEWMPAELRDRSDLTAGNDRGRIYRVMGADVPRGKMPALAELSNKSLTELLSHPNAWQRETAARLLLERQDRRMAGELEEVVLKHRSRLARIHALRLLDALGALHESLLIKLLDDSDSRMVEQAVIVAEPYAAKSNALRSRIADCIVHDDARVRFQSLLVATPLPRPPAKRADRWEVDAILVAAGQRGGTVLAAMLRDPHAWTDNVDDPESFMGELARLAAASFDARERSITVEAIVGQARFARRCLASFLAEEAQQGRSLPDVQAELSPAVRQKVSALIAAAAVDAGNDELHDETRCEAIELITWSPDRIDLLTKLALEDANLNVRLAALAALAKKDTAEPWQLLLERFARESPATQRAILDAVLSSAERIRLLLDAIEAGHVQPAEIDANRTRALVDHANSEIRRRAHSLLADALPSDREQALATYRAALAMAGNPKLGRNVFSKHCASCHMIDGVGIQFAPDISDSREKSAEQLLTDIVQPNRAIDSNYFSYTATTVDGVVHTGVLAAETSTSVTLRQAEGKSVTLHRHEIDELRSDGISLMPDGMERNISLQEMADLIAFIKNWRYLASPEQAR